ncbi:MAG: hypothetical protein COS84_09460 [Armatimonadetes bacterium CG07_land_8_20_14_0_80_40_9]|nr:MAG: hypothetical protein COS84_09460 [Armatimonadetes bacterium CG07_land_8_20_14_0_80_40_9]
MTTHVFIVDENTFPFHLQYKFAGTGAKEADEHIDLLADIKRVRPGDKVVFYLLGVGFYGIFRIAKDAFVIKDPIYLLKRLKKKLIYRIFIEHDEVYPKYVTEWEALEKLPLYAQDIIWSLIYRKLKGERGCTPITVDETNRLLDMIREHNQEKYLNFSSTDALTWDRESKEIEVHYGESVVYQSNTASAGLNISNEIHKRATVGMTFKDICSQIKREFSFPRNSKYESFLQAYFTENIAIDPRLDPITGNRDELVWVGNEVACGVGMQKIDILAITSDDRENKEYRIVELKVEEVAPTITYQLERYVSWTDSYIKGAINSNIQPIVVAPSLIKEGKDLKNWDEVRKAFSEFNNRHIAKEIKYFEFDIKEKDVLFHEVTY